MPQHQPYAGIVETLAYEAQLPHDLDFDAIEEEWGADNIEATDVIKLEHQIGELVKALNQYRQHLARRLADEWRPTRLGDDVVIVSYPKPSRKVHDEDTFWSFVGDIILRDLSEDPEIDVEEAVVKATRTIGLLFNPNAIRIGAFKQAVSALGIDGATAVDSLYTDPQPDTTKPPKVGRVPITKYPSGYRVPVDGGYEWVEREET